MHLGRAFVTEVTLQVIPNQRLRCQNWFDIAASDLFGAPGSNGNTLDSYITQIRPGGGHLVPVHRPAVAQGVDRDTDETVAVTADRRPYPYTFANFVNQQESDFIKQVVQGDVSGTPPFENSEMAIVGSGLITDGHLGRVGLVRATCCSTCSRPPCASWRAAGRC